MQSPQNFVPAYLQIKSEIMAWIRSGKLKPGDPLPGRWQLVEHFNTSWGTLNRAVSELIIEGVLRAEKGKGTFVHGSDHKQHPTDVQKINVFICHPKATVYHSLGLIMEGIREEAFRHKIKIEYADVPMSDIGDLNFDRHIVITPTHREIPQLHKRWESGQRFIVLGSDFPGVSFPCLNADTRNGTFQGVEHLIQNGHTRIALFGVQDAFPNYQREIEGYRDAMFHYQLPVEQSWIVKREDSMAETVELFEKWLAANPACTAIFSADYTSTMAILTVCEKRELAIPGDLSVVTMDEVPAGDFLKTPLTTVVQPFLKLGGLAAAHLIGSADDNASTRLLPCSIQYRRSVGPIGDRAKLPAE